MPKKSGFTLVELLVVISIIAILSAIGITVFSAAQQAARDGRRRADLLAIAQALEIYRQQKGNYPTSGVSGGTVYNSDAAQPWITGLDESYMVRVPVDPKNTGGPAYSGGYTYGYWSGGSTGSAFMLYTHLEKPSADDLSTKCKDPTSGDIYYPGYGGGTLYVNNYFVCSQQ